MTNKTIAVNAKALEELLRAVIGPPHFIRELQVTRGLPSFDNCIDVLQREFNTAITMPATQPQGEPVAWQFYQDGKWWNGDDRIKDHRKNTVDAGYKVRDLYAEQPAPCGLLKEIIKGWEESAYGDPSARMAQAIKAVREHLSKAESPAPLATEAAKAFAKGFNTLESGGGRYRINMQFQSREDAWGAFNVLARLKQLNTPQ